MTDKIDDETRAFKDEMRKLGLTAKGMTGSCSTEGIHLIWRQE